MFPYSCPLLFVLRLVKSRVFRRLRYVHLKRTPLPPQPIATGALGARPPRAKKPVVGCKRHTSYAYHQIAINPQP